MATMIKKSLTTVWMLLIVFQYGVKAQPVKMLDYGFETANPSFTYDMDNGISLDRANTGAHTGSWSAAFDGDKGNDKIDASVITPMMTFEPGYAYTVHVYAKSTDVKTTLKVALVTQPLNGDVSSATGADLLLVTEALTASYQEFTATFTVTQAMSRHMGFHIKAKKNYTDVNIDDIIVERVCQVPTAAAGTDQSLCNSISGTLAGNATLGGDGLWTLVSGSATIDSPSDSNSTVSNLGYGANTFRWTISKDACSTSDDVVVYNYAGRPAEPDPVSGIPASVCAPQSIVLSTQSAGAVTYQWTTTTPQGVVFTGAVDGPAAAIDLLPMTTNSIYKIRVSATNACGTSSERQEGIRYSVSTPQPVTGPAIACAGSAYGYSVPPVAGAETYTWNAPAGALIDGQPAPLQTTAHAVTVGLPAGFTGGTVSVSATRGCFTSGLRTLAIAQATAVPGNIAGASGICPGSTSTYTITPIAGATGYQWSVPAGCTITSPQPYGPSVDVAFPAGYDEKGASGNICVNTTSACAVTSADRCQSVVTLVPPMPSGIVSAAGSSGLCDGSFIFTTGTHRKADVYQWEFPAGVTATGPVDEHTITLQFPNNFTAGDVKVKAANAACAVYSDVRILAVAGAPTRPGAIALTGGICNNGTGTFAIDAVAGATAYAWELPANGAVINSQSNAGANPSVDVTWGTGAGFVSVRAQNTCGAGEKEMLYVSPSCRLAEQTVDASQDHAVFGLYPNPASGRVTVTLPADIGGTATFTLSDASGRTVMQTTFDAGATSRVIGLEDLPRGLYIADVTAGAYGQRAKLIIR